MGSISFLLHGLVLGMLVLTSAAAPAEEAQAANPEVRALLFYAPACDQCSDVFGYLLPRLLERYGRRLEVAGIDVSGDPGAALYGSSADRYGLSPEWAGEPVILVANRALVGLFEIAEVLGDRFEELASQPGAAHWPEVDGLEPLLAGGVETVKVRVGSETVLSLEDTLASTSPQGLSPGDKVADALAVASLVGMVLALLHGMTRLRRRQGTPQKGAARVLVAFLLLGLGISGYTAYTALAGVVPVCGAMGGCAEVQNSEYARLFGIPMGILGLLGYGAVLVSWIAGRRLSPAGGGWRWLPWAIALGGLLFSIRLTALEIFVIGATCVWCLGSAACMTAAFWLLSGETHQERPSPRRWNGP